MSSRANAHTHAHVHIYQLHGQKQIQVHQPATGS